VARDTALEFLRLYTNYRLKVASALERGMDKDESVKADIANNRRLLSETWYLDKAFADRRVDELAHRRMEEVKMSIILCAVMDSVTRKWDTVRSKAKADAIVAQLKAGADFAKIARDSSDDRETGSKGGQLPWISGGSIIKNVEDEAHGLKKGSFSTKPIETRFGYFIVKVSDRGKREDVKFRHLLLQKKDDRDSIGVEMLADSLLQILRAKPAQQAALLKARGLETGGDAFETITKAYSNDDASAPKGGYLGAPYSRSEGLQSNHSRLVPEFENAVFQLKDGEVSGKVHTLYGVHIIRRDSTRAADSTLERDNAKKTYRRLYYEDDKRAHYDSLKKAWGYVWYPAVTDLLLSSIDTTKNSNDTSWWKPISPGLMQQTLYSYPSRQMSVREFTDSLRLRMDMRGYTLNRSGMERAMNKIIDPILLDQATKDLDKKDPEFAALMREFNDGILLFKVEEQEVWSKLKFDTVDARRFFDTTRSRWRTEQRYVISEIYVLTDSAANDIQQQLLKGADFATLAREHTQRQGMREKNGLYPAQATKTSALARYAEEHNMKAGETSAPFTVDRGTAIIRLETIEPPREKTFEEAMPELAPAYQDQLQKRLTEAWLGEVRQRYPVVYNAKVIDEIWGKP
jgi:peptidyl-prolyl cis-trans isomerase SurA